MNHPYFPVLLPNRQYLVTIGTVAPLIDARREFALDQFDKLLANCWEKWASALFARAGARQRVS